MLPYFRRRVALRNRNPVGTEADCCFGRQDKVVVAERLLQEIEPMCIEEIVEMSGSMSSDTEIIYSTRKTTYSSRKFDINRS